MGTTLSINPWVMHYSTKFWGQDAAEFKPDRWMVNDDAAVMMDKYFIPVSPLDKVLPLMIADGGGQWGVGYQSCPGQNTAKIELSKLAAVLVRDYNIRQVDEGKEWEWKAYITCVPHCWDCYVSKRTVG